MKMLKGHSLITDNPVKRLSQTRAWYRVERRQTYIKPHELAAWYQGVFNTGKYYIAGLFIVCLYLPA